MLRIISLKFFRQYHLKMSSITSMKFKILALLFFQLILKLGYSQSISQLQDSVNHYISISPKKTIDFVNQTQKEYKTKKDWSNYIFGYFYIANSYLVAGDNEQAKQYLEDGLEDAKKRKLPEDDRVYSYIWNFLGVLAYYKSDFSNATMYCQKSLDADKKLGRLNEDAASRYINIASILDEFGDYEQAIYHYKEALQYASLSDKYTLGTAYNALGFAYFNLKKYDIALENYKKAMQLFNSKDYNDKRIISLVSMLYLNTGELYAKQENYQEALNFFDKKLKLKKESARDTSSSYENIGFILSQQNKTRLAIDTLNKALEIRKRVLSKKHYILSRNYRILGNIHQSQKNYKKALDSYQSAIIAVVYDFDNKNVNKNPTLDNIVHQVELLKSLSAKAKTLQLINKNKEALEVYQLCSQLLDKMRFSFQHNASKLFFIEEGIPIYEAAIATALTIGDKNTAFELAEKSKAMLLLEAMRGLEARFGLPSDLVKQENDLKIDIAYYERQIWEERQKEKQDEESIKKWESLVFDLKEQSTKLKNQINNDYPEYYKIKYNSQASSVRDVQRKLLNNKTAMISYFIGEKQVFIFTITKKGIEITTLDKTDNLTDWVENMRLCLQRDSRIANLHEVYYQTAFQLYQIFLAPALKDLPKGINRLIIIPDDQLNFIPFETLLTTNPNLSSPRYELKKVPYLIRDYQMTYGYSATLLIEGLEKRKAKNLKSFGGFVPNFQQGNSIQRGCDGDVLGNLPFGRENIFTINEIMDGQLFFDEQATIDEFKTLAEEYKILHLCTHACAEMDFKDTRIYFSDKELLAFELYNMPLNAELAVLSACETGIGELKRGEGVMSLARAFMYSGCPSVVTSLWSVDDKSTSEIMRCFYQHIKDGKTQDEALHQAKLDYLDGKGIEASHPFYWSGFVHIGNAEPLFGNDGMNYWYWIGSSLILLAIGFYFWRKR